MSVTLLLTSGGQRIIHRGDSARLDGPFFIVSHWDADRGQWETVVTLRAEDVIGAEIVKDGVKTEYIPGGGRPG